MGRTEDKAWWQWWHVPSPVLGFFLLRWPWLFVSENFWSLGNRTGEGKGTEGDLQIQLPQPHSVPVDCVTRLLASSLSGKRWSITVLVFKPTKGDHVSVLIERQGNFIVEEGQGGLSCEDREVRIWCLEAEFYFSLSFSLSGPWSGSTLGSKCFGFKFWLLFLTLPIC